MAQVGVDVGSYVFDASAKTITFIDVEINSIEQVKLVVNGDKGVFIFNPLKEGYLGTIKSNVLTLEYDTKEQSDTDPLYICVNIGGDVNTSILNQTTENTKLLKGINNLIELQCETVKYLKKIYSPK